MTTTSKAEPKEEITFLEDDFTFDKEGDGYADAISRPSIPYWADAWRRLKKNPVAIIAMSLLGMLLVMVIIGPYFNSHSATSYESSAKNQSPSSEYWFGTDNMGRDIFTRVWEAGRVSIAIGVIGAAINVSLGLVYGGISGYLGGAIDNILMRIVEFIGCVPKMLVIILVSIVLSPSIPSLIFALTISGWTGTARMIRGRVLQLKSNDFVSASIALGASPWHIITTHMFPNVMSQLIVSTTLAIPSLIFAEAFLSFIGLGVTSPNTSWGAMCSAAQTNLFFYPYQLFFPTLMISITMLSFNLLGDGLRDALDPRLRN
ncbi:MAG: ABC transporter permease [Eubacteriales bacterium]